MLSMLLVAVNTGYALDNEMEKTNDFDPLTDVSITFELEKIRWLEEPLTSIKPFDEHANPIFSILKIVGSNYYPPSRPFSTLDDFNPYVKVIINGIEYESKVWTDDCYIHHPDWNVTVNVPDDYEEVDITVQLWNRPDSDSEFQFDLSPAMSTKEAQLTYSIATGHWAGDDYLKDESGYGRLSGCDDGSIYEIDDDAELWFSITQTDYDHDGIPYWIEVNEYGTDPEQNEAMVDLDNDSIPCWWEHQWGYDPVNAEDHQNLDDDADSIDNYEEYLTAEWYSDPFRKDVFVEQDIMGVGPNGETSHFPDGSGELIRTAFNRQNIVFHLDNGSMGGQDIIPFEDNVNRDDLNRFYDDYFLHNNKSNWRRGVFHYGVVTYSSVSAAGYMYRSNAFQISSRGHDNMVKNNPDLIEDIVYASAYMHELGHTFGYFPIPGHNRLGGVLGVVDFIRAIPYQSCMNYGYMYIMVDYSDGSHMFPDYDDWSPPRLDLDAFEREW